MVVQPPTPLKLVADALAGREVVICLYGAGQLATDCSGLISIMQSSSDKFLPLLEQAYSAGDERLQNPSER